MKATLFCQNPYAFGILNPIKKELEAQGDSYLWYVPDEIFDAFPFKNDPYTSSITEVIKFQPDAHFVPGNEIPHYLRGVKAQVFHGFAGEKKGHFRIRHYFDLYLTQGPHFTRGFMDLRQRFKNFEVMETGWPKLDAYVKERSMYDQDKADLLKETQTKSIILYAPTFSPALTSAPFLIKDIESLAQNPDYLILIKFHDLMDDKWITAYEKLAQTYKNIRYERAHNILKYLLMADLLVSDTSSVIYEFLLLDKPAITFKNISNHIHWDDQKEYENLAERVRINLTEDPYKQDRSYIFNELHPYKDGLSSRRMVEAVKKYISDFGIPKERKVSLLRKYKMNKMFGRA